MLDQAELLWGIIVPPLLMLFGMFLCGAIPSAGRLFSIGLWMSVSYAVCHLGLQKWPTFAASVHDWPAWFILFAGALTWCGKCHSGPWLVRALTRGVIIGAATWLMLRPQFTGMSLPMVLIWGISIGLIWLATVLGWERVYQFASTGRTTVGLAVTALITSLSLLLFNTMVHAQLAGIVTAMLVTSVIVAWLRPAWLSDRSLVTVTAFVLPALMLLGVYYADLPYWCAILLLTVGACPVVITSKLNERFSPLQRLLLQLGAQVVVAAPVIVWGIVTTMRAMAEPDYGY